MSQSNAEPRVVYEYRKRAGSRTLHIVRKDAPTRTLCGKRAGSYPAARDWSEIACNACQSESVGAVGSVGP